MWSAGSDTIHVFLGRSRLGLHRQGEAARWEQGASAADLWSRAVAGLNPRRRSSVHVWLGGNLARPFLLPPLEGLGTTADACIVAGSRANEETGLQGPCAVSIDAWRPRASTACVAMEEELRAAILAAGSGRVRIAGIRPWWSAVLCDPGTEARATCVLSVDDGESLVVLAGADDGIDLAASYSPAPDAAQREALVRRILSARGEGPQGHRHARLAMPPDLTGGRKAASHCPFLPEWGTAP